MGLNWLEVILRSIITLIVLFFLTKMLGRKQISQLSLFEYIIGIVVGGIAAEISTGVGQNFLNGMYSLLIWALIPVLLTYLSLKSKKVRDFLDGAPVVVIKDGKIQEDSLMKEKHTVDDLASLLRKKNAFNIADVEFAVLEPSGELNVLLKKEKQPITPKDVQLQVAPEKEPKTVISEGMILDEALGFTGYNRSWLKAELEKLNVALDNVFLGQVDAYGKLTVDIYDDKIQLPKSQERTLLLATLKKCQADLELFTLATESKSASEMYQNNAQRLEMMVEKLKPYLKE
ncbi:hypothetical protein B5V88_15735 [Heyndrickxia sporothermodurans]|uniref:DUF421 domain-containing protein n=1 Tax=Heyndrickxia sporothermodurans TaxID=46224 RepID=A0AB37H6Z9_9BACI|nr:DUF421 domain-containing protein [Heyndrickxia sporothermodurans]MBL5769174.1 DUF421 domain-containing protein [Heyndrickxia sporothermodurans]MBL5772957.1 DUF421 domain-containing protein [Heyndrickxia sporothermodurans]MBL5776414.1 DUF421 domain-containing protein [Heyndrickxia sporothermodurans]MBL5779940.1 DUF421 domain-containing protein [Heyndrickxia sporothermodurans]MBL5783522.1 DUF421 domain-containing protein [Heyndrickxia sporothermodurans]